MQRIAIIGCGGSGKSTLARDLGRKLGLPVQHLDQLFWRPGWIETPTAQWRAIQEEVSAQPAWIIDGNYTGTIDLRLTAADAIVFFDFPTWLCLHGAVRRFLQHRGRTRPDMAEQCPERLDLRYLWWICNYRRTRRPGILRKLEQISTHKRVVVLCSRRAVREFLNSVGGHSQATDPESLIQDGSSRSEGQEPSGIFSTDHLPAASSAPKNMSVSSIPK